MRLRKALTFMFVLMLIFTNIFVSDVNAMSMASQSSEKAAYAEGQLLVRFDDHASESERNDVRKAFGLVRQKTFKIGVELVAIGNGADPAVLAEALSKNPRVLYAHPDYIIERPRNELRGINTTDTESDELWGLDAVDAPEAWNEGATGSGIVVAVIDSGIMTTHEDLAGNMWVNPGEGSEPNNIDDDGNGFVDDIHGWNVLDETGEVFEGFDQLDPYGYPQDEHGTHVAGTIGAIGNNGKGVIGVAPDVAIMSLKFFGSHSDSGRTSEAIQAIEYATDEGADVINASWGGGSANTALRDAIAAFPGVFVAAAGNDGEDTDQTPHYPSSYPVSNILSVASSDMQVNSETGILSVFSNYGDVSVDIAAPGGGIFQGYVFYRGKYYMSYTDLILSTYPYEEGTEWNTKYERMGGTSMAAPHVSGVVALMLSTGNYNNRPPSDVVVDLMASGMPHPLLEGKVASGMILNAYGAVTEYGKNNSGNEAPVAYDDEYSVYEDEVLEVLAVEGVLSNDTDFELDPMAAVLVNDVTHGSLTLNGDGSFTYVPDANFDSIDSFTYRANDGKDSNTATVMIQIIAENDAPISTDDSYSTEVDTALSIDAPGVLGNDSDVDSGLLSAHLYSDASNGTLSLATDGSFVYLPNAGFTGVDIFTYRAFDGEAYSDAATVEISVDPPAPQSQEVVTIISPNEGDSFTTKERITIQVGVVNAETLRNVSGVPVEIIMAQYSGGTEINVLLNELFYTGKNGKVTVTYRVSGNDPRGIYMIEARVNGVTYLRSITIQ